MSVATAATASYGEQSSLLAIVQSQTSASALATKLLAASQAHNAASNAVSCADASGDQCAACTLPMRDNLVQELAKIKLALWNEHQTFQAKSKTLCTATAPSSRKGGYARCCAIEFNTKPAFLPMGYTGCKYNKPTVGVAAAINPNDELSNDGVKWTGGQHVDTLLRCCDSSSNCLRNEVLYTAKLRQQQSLAVSAKARLTGEVDKLEALKLQKKYTDDSVLEAGNDKVSLLAKRTALFTQGNLTMANNKAQSSHFASTAALITKVITLIQTDAPKLNSQKAMTGNEIKSTPALALLESASFASSAVMVQATQLVQAGYMKTSAWNTVVTMLIKLRAATMQQHHKHVAFQTQLQQSVDDQSTAIHHSIMRIKQQVVKYERLQADIAANIVASDASKLADEKILTQQRAAYKSFWELRETNAQKCLYVIKYYDTSAVTRTQELLVLKKAVEIIKQITCNTAVPTPFPTAFPTAAPVPITGTPTAFPTVSPTSYPTAFPTKAGVQCKTCKSGNWKFNTAALASNFPAAEVLEAAKLNIPLPSTATGACALKETTFTAKTASTQGMSQKITSYYRCCCDGNFFGGAGIAPKAGNSNAVSAHKDWNSRRLASSDTLCSSLSKYCELFNSNMMSV